jgi:hypothetical protein
MSGGYIVMRNWDTFQHYKDRNPTWIKTYTELLSDDAYLELSGHRRAILHGLWLAYATARCQLSDDTRILTRRLNLKVTTLDLKSLNDAGFLTFTDIKPISPRATSDSPHARARALARERSREEPLTPQSGDLDFEQILKDVDGTPRQRGTNPRALGTNPRAVRRKANLCPECELGGGYHTVDCSQAAKT